MISEKYIAGFLDADGSIQVYFRDPVRNNPDKNMKRAYIGVEFTQLTRRDEVLYLIKEVFDGKMYLDESKASTTLKIFGKNAVMLLYRIKKYLVVKRHYAEYVLTVANQILPRKETQKRLKLERKVKSLPIPNYPSRKWLAGYFDGDGCFSVRISKGRTSAEIYAEIVSDHFDSEGLELIQKGFGGSLNNKGKHSKLVISLSPSKAIHFIGHFGKHTLIKKSQTNFILSCAEHGNYRDGISIKQAIMQLKAQPHRLSESSRNSSEFIKKINFDIKTRSEIGKETWQENNNRCKCGSTNYYCDGFCRKCYDFTKNSGKRQSDYVTA